MKALIHNNIMQKALVIFASIAVAIFAFADVARAMPEVEEVVRELQQIIDENPGTPLADKAEDALAKAQTALDELAKTPPDYQAAVGNMEGAVGDLEAAAKDELLDAEQGTELMNLLTCAAWQLGAGAIYQAIDCEADADKIAEADQALAEGEGLWAAGAYAGAYKDAVNKYKDALAKAESAISGPVDPLAGVVTQDLVSQDGQLRGKAVLYYAECGDETNIRLNCWDLDEGTEYIVLLCEYADGGVTDCIGLGGFTSNVMGMGHLHASVQGDKSDQWVVFGSVGVGGLVTPSGAPVPIDSPLPFLVLLKNGYYDPELSDEPEEDCWFDMVHGRWVGDCPKNPYWILKLWPL